MIEDNDQMGQQREKCVCNTLTPTFVCWLGDSSSYSCQRQKGGHWKRWKYPYFLMARLGQEIHDGKVCIEEQLSNSKELFFYVKGRLSWCKNVKKHHP